MGESCGIVCYVSLETMLPIITRNCIWTLVRLEARVLCQNRMACVVILFILIAATMLRFQEANQHPSSQEVCYVLYWQEDDWIRRLQTAARAARKSGGLSIEVISVADLTGTDGVIRYPPKSHSIQLRPIEPTDDGRGGWLIWYWYSGTDAAAIFPYLQWFQQVTHEHFNDRLRWHERASPMHPQLALFGHQTHVAIDSFLKPDRIGVALIWLTIFFAGCHLSKLSLAQGLATKTIHSLAVTPAGWNGPVIAIGLFYGSIAVVLATAVAAIQCPEALTSFRFWITILCATLSYLGVGLTIASWCGSVASASVGTVVYFAFSGMMYAIACSLPPSVASVVAPLASADAAILTSVMQFGFDTPHDGGVILAMVVWSAVWQLIGAQSYRRLRLV